MSDMYGEAVRIVRTQRKGEAIPDYSTAALLFGCTWPVRVEKGANSHRMMGPSNNGEMMKERRDAKFAPHREMIIDLLQKKITMAAISRVIEMPKCSTARYINTHELKELAKKVDG